jgi:very-short-patch-repair endonuclease
VYRVTELHPADISEVRGIPVTAPARALLDLASACSGATLERGLSEAFARRFVSEGEIRACLARAPGRHGAGALRALLDSLDGPQITRSAAERELLRLLHDAGLPAPRTNVRLAGHIVDAFWPEHGLVVEIDGFAVHGHRSAFERDRARDQALLAAGYRVMRITWRQLLHQRSLVVANLAAALARSR